MLTMAAFLPKRKRCINVPCHEIADWWFSQSWSMIWACSCNNTDLHRGGGNSWKPWCHGWVRSNSLIRLFSNYSHLLLKISPPRRRIEISARFTSFYSNYCFQWAMSQKQKLPTECHRTESLNIHIRFFLFWFFFAVPVPFSWSQWGFFGTLNKGCGVQKSWKWCSFVASTANLQLPQSLFSVVNQNPTENSYFAFCWEEPGRY